jgi:hypothetical protein
VRKGGSTPGSVTFTVPPGGNEYFMRQTRTLFNKSPVCASRLLLLLCGSLLIFRRTTSSASSSSVASDPGFSSALLYLFAFYSGLVQACMLTGIPRPIFPVAACRLAMYDAAVQAAATERARRPAYRPLPDHDWLFRPHDPANPQVRDGSSRSRSFERAYVFSTCCRLL